VSTARRHTVRFARWLATGAALAVLFVGGTNAWVHGHAVGRAFASAAPIEAHAVAIVPGADLWKRRPGGTLTARLETALALYRSGRVKAIFISGNDTALSPEVTAMHGWLRDHAVPELDIWSDPNGARTRATMIDAAASFDIKDAVVCTQAPYVDRAIFLAREAGIDAVGVGLPSPVSRSARGLGIEAIKTTSAFLESYLRQGPTPARSAPDAKSIVAAR
jgi:vancomycin permeability regulator SanA